MKKEKSNKIKKKAKFNKLFMKGKKFHVVKKETEIIKKQIYKKEM